MTKVRILTSVAGAGIAWSAGQIVEMTTEQADAWADGERAERVDARRVETTTEAPPETAADERVVETQMNTAPERRARSRARRPR